MKNQEKEPKYVDLHLHTHHSDGTSSPQQIVKDCALLGLETIAITDHDHTIGYYEAHKEAQKWGLEVITGVEISTDDYHILGYDIDLNHQELQEFILRNRELANTKTYRRVEKLQEQGIPISKEKIDSYFPNRMLNKVHIAMTMILDKDCKSYVGRNDTNALIKTYLAKNTAAGQIEKVYFPKPEEAITIIHQAGGKAILAHPPKDVHHISEVEAMRKSGLDGIELQPRMQQQNKIYEEYAKQHKMIITYGSDFHGSRYINRPLIGRLHGNKIKPFWK